MVFRVNKLPAPTRPSLQPRVQTTRRRHAAASTRCSADSLLEPVRGPSVWLGSELAQRPEEWIVELGAGDLEELERVICSFEGRDLSTVTREEARIQARRLNLFVCIAILCKIWP